MVNILQVSIKLLMKNRFNNQILKKLETLNLIKKHLNLKVSTVSSTTSKGSIPMRVKVKI